MDQSFIKNPALAARIKALPIRGFATSMAVGSTIDLLLYRGPTDVQVGTTTVLVSYADRQAQTDAGDAGGVTESDGTFAAFAPWDVEREDRFVMPATGTTGVIKLVEEPANGIQRARFSLQAGA